LHGGQRETGESGGRRGDGLSAVARLLHVLRGKKGCGRRTLGREEHLLVGAYLKGEEMDEEKKKRRDLVRHLGGKREVRATGKASRQTTIMINRRKKGGQLQRDGPDHKQEPRRRSRRKECSTRKAFHYQGDRSRRKGNDEVLSAKAGLERAENQRGRQIKHVP